MCSVKNTSHNAVTKAQVQTWKKTQLVKYIKFYMSFNHFKVRLLCRLVGENAINSSVINILLEKSWPLHPHPFPQSKLVIDKNISQSGQHRRTQWKFMVEQIGNSCWYYSLYLSHYQCRATECFTAKQSKQGKLKDIFDCCVCVYMFVQLFSQKQNR